MFGAILAAIGGGASVIGSFLQYQGQKKAADAAQKQQALSARRSRRQAIRQAQIQRAQTMAIGSATGALTSSGIAGGLGSLGSQLGSDFGYGTQMSGLSSRITQGQNLANIGGAISSLGGTAMSAGLAMHTPSPTPPPQPKVTGFQSRQSPINGGLGGWTRPGP